MVEIRNAWASATMALRQALGHGYMQGLLGYKQIHTLVSMGVIPGALFLIFTLLGGRELSQHVLFGTLVIQAVSAGLVSLPQQVVIQRGIRLLEMYVASPISPLSYMMGFAIGRAMFMIPGLTGVLALLLGLGFLEVSNLLMTLFVIAVAFVVGCMMGFTIATYIQNIYAVSPVTNMLNGLFIMLPPVLYPLSIIPDRLQWIVYLTPTSVLAELMRIVNGVSESVVNHTLLWLIALTWVVACTYIVASRSKWRES